jgi:hypothetical protein
MPSFAWRHRKTDDASDQQTHELLETCGGSHCNARTRHFARRSPCPKRVQRRTDPIHIAIRPPPTPTRLSFNPPSRR